MSDEPTLPNSPAAGQFEPAPSQPRLWSNWQTDNSAKISTIVVAEGGAFRCKNIPSGWRVVLDIEKHVNPTKIALVGDVVGDNVTVVLKSENTHTVTLKGAFASVEINSKCESSANSNTNHRSWEILLADTKIQELVYKDLRAIWDNDTVTHIMLDEKVLDWGLLREYSMKEGAFQDRDPTRGDHSRKGIERAVPYVEFMEQYDEPFGYAEQDGPTVGLRDAKLVSLSISHQGTRGLCLSAGTIAGANIKSNGYVCLLGAQILYADIKCDSLYISTQISNSEIELNHDLYHFPCPPQGIFTRATAASVHAATEKPAKQGSIWGTDAKVLQLSRSAVKAGADIVLTKVENSTLTWGGSCHIESSHGNEGDHGIRWNLPALDEPAAHLNLHGNIDRLVIEGPTDAFDATIQAPIDEKDINRIHFINNAKIHRLTVGSAVRQIMLKGVTGLTTRDDTPRAPPNAKVRINEVITQGDISIIVDAKSVTLQELACHGSYGSERDIDIYSVGKSASIYLRTLTEISDTGMVNLFLRSKKTKDLLQSITSWNVDSGGTSEAPTTITVIGRSSLEVTGEVSSLESRDQTDLDVSAGGYIKQAIGTYTLTRMSGVLVSTRIPSRERCWYKRRWALCPTKLTAGVGSPAKVLDITTDDISGILWGLDVSEVPLTRLMCLRDLEMFEPDMHSLRVDVKTRGKAILAYRGPPGQEHASVALTLRTQAEEYAQIAAAVEESNANGNVYTQTQWLAAHCHAQLGGPLERLMRRMHRLVGYSYRPMPALLTLLSTVLFFTGMYTVVGVEAKGADELSLWENLLLVLKLPFRLIPGSAFVATLDTNIDLNVYTQMLNVLLISFLAVFMIIALRHFMRRPAKRGIKKG